MKKVLVLLMIVAAFAIINCGHGVDIEAEKTALKETLEKTVDAEKRMDADAVVTLFTEDVIVQPQDMPQISGTQALHDLYIEFFKTLVSMDSKSTENIVASSGDMAYDTGWNLFVFKGPDGNIEVKGKYLAVLKKVDSEWKIAAIAFSNDQPLK